jgi:hypothetical protein
LTLDALRVNRAHKLAEPHLRQAELQRALLALGDFDG